MTVYGKTRHMGFFVKIKFDVYVIGSEKRVNFVHIPNFGFKTLITQTIAARDLNFGMIILTSSCYTR